MIGIQRWFNIQKQVSVQWNRTESPEINPDVYGKLIFNEPTENTQERKESLFHKWC